MKYKFPKIFHLPFSNNLQNNDKKMESLDGFQDKRVIVSLKCDGENFSFYRDCCHARSLDSKDHPSRHWIKRMWGEMKHNIPEGWRICGENCFAFHSIYYTELPSYFLVFEIYNDKNMCLSWDETVEYCQLLDLQHVPILYDGIWDEEKIKSCFDENKSILGGWSHKGLLNTLRRNLTYMFAGNLWEPDEEYNLEDFAKPAEEGYVVRIADAFSYDDHYKYTAKYVRDFISTTSDFWMTQFLIPNKLKGWIWNKKKNEYRKK